MAFPQIFIDKHFEFAMFQYPSYSKLLPKESNYALWTQQLIFKIPQKNEHRYTTLECNNLTVFCQLSFFDKQMYLLYTNCHNLSVLTLLQIRQMATLHFEQNFPMTKLNLKYFSIYFSIQSCQLNSLLIYQCFLQQIQQLRCNYFWHPPTLLAVQVKEISKSCKENSYFFYLNRIQVFDHCFFMMFFSCFRIEKNIRKANQIIMNPQKYKFWYQTQQLYSLI